MIGADVVSRYDVDSYFFPAGQNAIPLLFALLLKKDPPPLCPPISHFLPQGTMCDKERQAVIVGVGRYTQSKTLEVELCTTPVGMQVPPSRPTRTVSALLLL
jgi:hypothetical protein